ncbi:MAG: mechanosensitive ion channel [Nitrospirota bacterium]|nr:mechanosensitive ion channel [Nitrospirota bacterium]
MFPDIESDILIAQLYVTLGLIEKGLVADLQKAWPRGGLFLALTLMGAGLVVLLGKWLKSPAGFIRLALSFLFLLLVSALLGYDPKNGVYILAQNLAILWMGLEMMRFALNSLGVERRWTAIVLVMVFLVLGTGAITYVRLSSLYAHRVFERYVTLYRFLGFVAKLASSLGIGVFMVACVPALTMKVPERYRKFWGLTLTVGMGGVLVLLGLWVRERVIFDIWLLLALSLLSVLISVYALFYARSDTLVQSFYPLIYYEPDEYALIRTHLRRIVLFGLAYAYWVTGRQFFRFGTIEAFLKDITLIQTSLYTLNLATFLNALLTFLFLYSCLILSTKYLRVLLGEKYAETLFQNLGLLIVFFLTVLAMNMPWQVLAALTGAFSVGLGIGSSAMVGNYIACLSLLFSNRLRIGDMIELPGEVDRLTGVPGAVLGKVRDIGALMTTVRTFENVDVYIPNSAILNDRVANYSAAESPVALRIMLDEVRELKPKEIKSRLSRAFEGFEEFRVSKGKVRIVGQKEGAFQVEVSFETNLRLIGNPKAFLAEMKERLWMALIDKEEENPEGQEGRDPLEDSKPQKTP